MVIVSVLVTEDHIYRIKCHRLSWFFSLEAQAYIHLRLDTDDQTVWPPGLCSFRRKSVLRSGPELNGNDGGFLMQHFTCPYVKRHILPPPVIDIKFYRAECV